MLIDLAQRFERIRRVFADQGYKAWLVDWVTRWLPLALDIVVKPPTQVGFQVHPKRWLVERSFGWFTNFRRLSKDGYVAVAWAIGTIRCPWANGWLIISGHRA
jgi:transposase